MASRARWATLISYFLVQGIGLLIAMLIMQVPRAPLPRDEIAGLSQAMRDGRPPWPAPRIELSAAQGALPAGELEELRRHLAAALEAEGAQVSIAEVPPAELLGREACTSASSDIAACLAALEDHAAEGTGGDEPLASSFQLLLVPAVDSSSLLLDVGRGAVLRWRRAPGLATTEELAQALAVRLQQTWLRQVRLEAGATLFEVAPAYVFSFFLVGDCRWRVAWDFQGGVLAPLLGRFFSRLGRLFDLEVDSQVVQCGSLSGPPTRAGGRVDAAALRADFLSHAGEWPGDTVTRGARWLPPLVRFVAFKHSGDVQVVDAENQEQRSFAVQGWGTVAITSERDAACEAAKAESGGFNDSGSNVKYLLECEAQQVASAWVSNLRSWLTLPPDAPVPHGEGAADSAKGGLALYAAKPRYDGLSAWELLRVARALHGHFVQRTAETLENLLDLVDSLPDVVVRAEIGEMAFEAAAAARRACAAAADGDLEGALAAARRGLALALTASHDDTVVAQMYFSWEFKYAVYLPLGLPIIVPVMVAMLRQLKQVRAVRNLKGASARTRASGGAEHVM